MAANVLASPAARRTPNHKTAPSPSSRRTAADAATTAAAAESKARFEAYNRLQAAAVAFGEKLPIPEIPADESRAWCCFMLAFFYLLCSNLPVSFSE
jgi:hypothetical protein